MECFSIQYCAHGNFEHEKSSWDHFNKYSYLQRLLSLNYNRLHTTASHLTVYRWSKQKEGLVRQKNKVARAFYSSSQPYRSQIYSYTLIQLNLYNYLSLSSQNSLKSQKGTKASMNERCGTLSRDQSLQLRHNLVQKQNRTFSSTNLVTHRVSTVMSAEAVSCTIGEKNSLT